MPENEDALGVTLTYMRRDEMEPARAVALSVQTRTRPIFMSATTSLLALSPLVLSTGAGSELYRGLGSVVIGGLAVSTVFTLFLIPSLLSLVYSLGGALRKGSD